jgi:hypothetical protein
VRTDVIIKGEIEESDGEYVTVRINVRDALGHDWFEKSYSTQTALAR